MPINKPHDYHRIGIYPLEAVLPFVFFGKKEKSIKLYDEHPVKMGSLRYQVFASKGTKCVKCGLEGRYFALEQNFALRDAKSKSFHFNLYGLDESGEEVLFTKDHITPKSRNGSDQLENLQPMCYPCNYRKKDYDNDDDRANPLRYREEELSK